MHYYFTFYFLLSILIYYHGLAVMESVYVMRNANERFLLTNVMYGIVRNKVNKLNTNILFWRRRISIPELFISLDSFEGNTIMCFRICHPSVKVFKLPLLVVVFTAP